MSAAARDRDPSHDDLRPTREVPLRPTREPNAPFVPGPTAPPIASAPRVLGPRGGVPAQRARRVDRPERVERADCVEQAPPPERVHQAAVPADRLLIAAFDARRVAAGMVELRARGLTVTPMRRAAAGPAGLSRELRRAVHRATIAATSLGAIGALIGALIVPSEALVPTLGWVPGPAVGAALLAGVLGALGFALGLLAILITPQRALSPVLAGTQTLLAVQSPESVDAIAAAIVAAGGSVVAH